VGSDAGGAPSGGTEGCGAVTRRGLTWGLLLMSFPQMSGFVTNQYIL